MNHWTARTAFALFFMAAPAVLFSCSTPSKVVKGPVSQNRLFPDGNYKHKVDLTIPPHGDVGEKKFSFTGVVQIHPEAIRIVGLSYFNTTAFKITEDRATGKVDVAIYVEPMKKFEPKLREYYSVVRELLLANDQAPGSESHIEWLKTNSQGLPIEMKTRDLEKNATLRILDFDKNNVPSEFEIDHPNFKVNVKVTSYEI